MSFFGLGPGELLLIMVLALIVFGPRRLPEIGAGLGRAIREFQRATAEITQEFTKDVQVDTPAQEPRRAEGPVVVETPQPSPAETTRTVMEQRDAAAAMAVEHHQAEASSEVRAEVEQPAVSVEESASSAVQAASATATAPVVEAAPVGTAEAAKPPRPRRRRVAATAGEPSEIASAGLESTATVTDGPQETPSDNGTQPPVRRRRAARKPEPVGAVTPEASLSQEA